jgi:hypothetical protein
VDREGELQDWTPPLPRSRARIRWSSVTLTQPAVMFPSPVHWSKDFVEHLRTVHFALIGAATGLILIVLSAKPYDPAIALRQIHQIIELKKMWSRDWLVGRGTVKYISFSTAESYPQSSFDLSAVGTGQLGFPQPLGEIAERFYAEVLDKRGRQQGVVQFSVEGESRWMQDFPRGWSAEAFPNTLADFQKWWDFLEMHHYKAIFPLTVAYTTGEAIANGGPRLLPINESEGLQEKSPDRVSLALGFRGYAPIYGGSGRFGSYSLSVERLSYVEVSQESIVGQFRNWKVGPFNSTFTDLSHATRDLEGLELDDVERFMSSEAAKGTEVFEAFGMKFPAGQITLWGIVLLECSALLFRLSQAIVWQACIRGCWLGCALDRHGHFCAGPNHILSHDCAATLPCHRLTQRACHLSTA